MTVSKFYSHWKDVPLDEWHWRYFTPKEIACNCEHKPVCSGHNSLIVVPSTMDKLDLFRGEILVPAILNSAYRSPAHNRAVGGSPGSKHLLGIAFDVRITAALNRDMIVKAALKVGFKGIGLYDTFIHIDDRETAASWDYRTEKS